jgi:hypothetical protein
VDLTQNRRRWNGLIVGILAAIMLHLSPSIDTNRAPEPWPKLLADEPVSNDPTFALLQQRAHGSLERLVQSAQLLERPQ